VLLPLSPVLPSAGHCMTLPFDVAFPLCWCDVSRGGEAIVNQFSWILGSEVYLELSNVYQEFSNVKSVSSEKLPDQNLNSPLF
jgi:hypothetical protein